MFSSYFIGKMFVKYILFIYLLAYSHQKIAKMSIFYKQNFFWGTDSLKLLIDKHLIVTSQFLLTLNKEDDQM